MREAGHDQATRGHYPAAKVISDRRHLDRDGAIALAKRLQQYWHDQGYPAVRFWTEPLDERFAKIGTYEVYQVKCNLVNGLPRAIAGRASRPGRPIIPNQPRCLHGRCDV
jgi:hypothetical protein